MFKTVHLQCEQQQSSLKATLTGVWSDGLCWVHSWVHTVILLNFSLSPSERDTALDIILSVSPKHSVKLTAQNKQRTKKQKTGPWLCTKLSSIKNQNSTIKKITPSTLIVIMSVTAEAVILSFFYLWMVFSDCFLLYFLVEVAFQSFFSSATFVCRLPNCPERLIRRVSPGQHLNAEHLLDLPAGIHRAKFSSQFIQDLNLVLWLFSC